MAISPQRLTIYLYSAHRAVIFEIAQLSCFILKVTLQICCSPYGSWCTEMWADSGCGSCQFSFEYCNSSQFTRIDWIQLLLAFGKVKSFPAVTGTRETLWRLPNWAENDRLFQCRSRKVRSTQLSVWETAILLLKDVYMTPNAARINHRNGPSGLQRALSATGSVMLAPGGSSAVDGQTRRSAYWPTRSGYSQPDVWGVISAEWHRRSRRRYTAVLQRQRLFSKHPFARLHSHSTRLFASVFVCKMKLFSPRFFCLFYGIVALLRTTNSTR